MADLKSRPRRLLTTKPIVWAEVCAVAGPLKYANENNGLEAYLVEGVGFEPT
jgi:hypothetical protein